MTDKERLSCDFNNHHICRYEFDGGVTTKWTLQPIATNNLAKNGTPRNGQLIMFLLINSVSVIITLIFAPISFISHSVYLNYS